MALIEILQKDLQQFLFMLLLLILSGLFSGSETALFSLGVSQLNALRRQRGPVSQAVLALRGELPDFLMTVLFCNMLINILFFAASTVLATDIVEAYGPAAGVIFGLVSLLLVITFGEVTPKTVAAIAQVPFCRVVAIPMYAIHRGLWLVRRGIGSLVSAFERIGNVQPPSPTVLAEEMRLLLESSRAGGVISTDEHVFINAVIELPDIHLNEIMTPRVDVVSIPLGGEAAELLALAREANHSKIPVRDPRTDEYVGWVDAREVFVAAAEGPLKSFIRKPLILSEFDHADQALQTFLATRARLAVVVDERGSTAGILALRDILSEIFGEIVDEDEEGVEPIVAEGDDAYLLDGRVSVREWRTLFGVVRELPRVATVGGLVVALLGRPPRVGDRVRLGNLVMDVREVHRRRVRTVRLLLQNGGAA